MWKGTAGGSTKVDELHERDIKPLTAAERLQLAAMILSDNPARSVVEYSEEWSPEVMDGLHPAGRQRMNSAV
jgi:hypothetical protein